MARPGIARTAGHAYRETLRRSQLPVLGSRVNRFLRRYLLLGRGPSERAAGARRERYRSGTLGRHVHDLVETFSGLHLCFTGSDRASAFSGPREQNHIRDFVERTVAYGNPGPSTCGAPCLIDWINLVGDELRIHTYRTRFRVALPSANW